MYPIAGRDGEPDAARDVAADASVDFSSITNLSSRGSLMDGDLLPVFLRPLSPDDAPQTWEWRNTPGMYDLTVGGPRTVSLETERRWLEQLDPAGPGSSLYLGICVAEAGVSIPPGDACFLPEANGTCVSGPPAGRLVGYCSLNSIDRENRRAEWGIVIGSLPHRSRGIATRALLLLLEVAFDRLRLHRVSSLWLAENERSLRLGRRLGFRQEGIFRDYVYRHGRWHDVIVMSLLDSEFQTVRQRLPTG